MEQDNDIAVFMKLLLIAGCVLLVGIGTHIVLTWSDQQTVPVLPSSRDSSYTQNK